MAGQTVVRCALLFVTVNAKAHFVVDHALGHGHLRDIAVTSGTIDPGPNVRGVIESHMRFFEESIYTLPRQVFTTLRGRPKKLNPRIFIIANVFMTSHAEIDARQPGARALRHTRVTFGAFDSDFIDVMDVVRELDRLFWLGLDAQIVSGSVAVGGVRSRECRGTPALRGVRVRDPA